MVLNYIWIAFFVIAFVVALIRLIVFGDTAVFPEMVGSSFDMAKTGFELSLGLTGVMTLWLGLMKVAEAGGVVRLLARITGPFFRKLMPEVPANHPVFGSIVMNLAANMLGLDNAATPLGLKAMNQLQELNPVKDTATNPMIMFLVLNASGLTLIPVSIMVYRAQLGAADPSDIFIPILISTFFSTLAGVLAVSFFQRIKLWQPVILAYGAGLTLAVAAIIWYFVSLPQDRVGVVSSTAANVILMAVMVVFIVMALRKKVNVYDTFIEGAKEGFQIAIRVIPYLVAILVGVGVFRASGALDFLVDGLGQLVTTLGFDNQFTGALPVAFMKPLSGSGARGLMIETMTHYGADSFAGRLACTFQGAADTTFYIIAVYFGSVGVRKTRHAVAGGLIADLAGVLAAIAVAYLFFG
ncbi:MAG: nucleoside recognition domain-containing protein [Bacteroidales bacterium]|nr:nucleoside recognition domain-containing protein [Bacteroidales bacterium]MDD3666197.1 nucleoside recognition domain-containing protein [Bacteroidales bacterium]